MTPLLRDDPEQCEAAEGANSRRESFVTDWPCDADAIDFERVTGRHRASEQTVQTGGGEPALGKEQGILSRRKQVLWKIARKT